MATLVLLGALDTKGDEYAVIRDRVIEAGCDVLMINAGVLGDPDYPIAFSRADVATEAGSDIEALVAAGDRGAAVTAMAEGAASVAQRLCDEGRIHGILGMGGSGSSSIVGRTMQNLPIGFPKLLVSTMAAGDVSAFVGTSDVAMMYSVVDIAGINAVSSAILGNAAVGVAAMAAAYESRVPSAGTRPLVGATMYGTTTPCVNTARATLEALGYDVLVFHATGTGGRSMEALIRYTPNPPMGRFSRGNEISGVGIWVGSNSGAWSRRRTISESPFRSASTSIEPGSPRKPCSTILLAAS